MIDRPPKSPKVNYPESPRPSPRLPAIRSFSGTEDAPISQTLDPAPNNASPFNFTPTYFTPATPNLVAANASKRRGHRYKHSSISMNFFQPPEERAPLSIPISLPVPTLTEIYQSITRQQVIVLSWLVFKVLVTVLIYSIGSPGVHSLSTLSHMLAYETLAESTVSLVGLLANFNVWKTSSLRFPFALKRVEVLVAFALAAVLMFVGGDVMSHCVQEIVNPHSHGHNHNAAEEAISLELGDPHETSKLQHCVLIGLALAISFPSRDTQNSLSLATFFLALLTLFVPLLPHTASAALDAILTPCIAITMITLGWFGVKLFGGMLAMSYGGPDLIPDIKARLLDDPKILSVKDLGIWQVHHDLWQATARLEINGSPSLETDILIKKLVDEALQQVPVTDVTWDTTIECIYT